MIGFAKISSVFVKICRCFNRACVILFAMVFSLAAVFGGKLPMAYGNEVSTNRQFVFQKYSQIKSGVSQKNIDSLQLYAQSAVLIDGESGRVLYEKNSEEKRPMASTTKIMTCILALELSQLSDVVTVSAKASSMPKVRLGMLEGEQYKMEDLLFSLMLESHNDSAVAIAEHIGGSMEGFAEIMNQKARDLGCFDTYFLTPNGLDASIRGKNGTELTHETTAKDLARIMRYCIKESTMKEEFIRITSAKTHSFENRKQTRSFSCNNHNAFLTMMEGALSGKTGFTAKAGYCYVGVLQQENRTFIVALLGCGWPNNKSYKWSDTKKLMSYGLDHFTYEEIQLDFQLPKLLVKNGIPDGAEFDQQARLSLKRDTESFQVLKSKEESLVKKINLPKYLFAPVSRNQIVGNVQFFLNGEMIKEIPIKADGAIKKKNFSWTIQIVGKKFLIFS